MKIADLNNLERFLKNPCRANLVPGFHWGKQYQYWRGFYLSLRESKGEVCNLNDHQKKAYEIVEAMVAREQLKTEEPWD